MQPLIALLFCIHLSLFELSLESPSGLTFDREDQLIVADTGNGELLIFGPDLELRTRVGKPGEGEGEFRQVSDVVQLPDGRYAVADAGNHRIQVFSSEWRFLFSFGRKGIADGEFNFPANVSVDSRGRIIVTDRFNHRLQVFSSGGKHLFTFGNREGEKPKDRIEWEKGRGKKDVEPQWQRTDFGQLNEPGGIFLDEDLGRLFLANGWNCRIEQLDYDVKTGWISRRKDEEAEGVVWGFWITRNCTGDSSGRLLGLQTAWGEIKIFEDRARLTHQSVPSKVLTPGALGRMRDITDIAISSRGEIAVADSGHDRIVIIPADHSLPEDVRVREIWRDGAILCWKTRAACPTEVLIRAGELPERTPGREDPWHDGKDPVWKVAGSDTQACHLHELKLAGLKPGLKYFYKVRLPEARILPDPGWSREYAINTRAKPGETEYLVLPLKVLLLPNVIFLPSVEQDSPFPEPMPEEDYEKLYASSFREVQLFYWANSRMKVFIEFDFYVDPAFYGKDHAPPSAPERFRELPAQDHERSFREAVERAGRTNKIYFGQLICECERRWQVRTVMDPFARKKKAEGSWVYQGSGGGTYGIEWPTPGRTHFLGGSDVAWLMCHEYKHQLESNCDLSGMTREDNRMWFCHFSPAHPGWQWDTAADHGEHWDGIAWQLRHMTCDQYLRLIYAHLATAPDKDGDGIPDRAPDLPLDEERFGSDAESQDGDGDGLTDMEEVLASTWVQCMNAPVRERIGLQYIRPNPRSPDTDGDGIPDGQDKYPIYPFRVEAAFKDVAVDGKLDEWKEKPGAFLEGFGNKAEAWLGWNNERLFLALAIEGKAPEVRVVFDFLSDGFYVGNDNLTIWLAVPPGGSTQLQDAKLHLCNMGRWPFFDTRDKESGRYSHFNPDELLFASGMEGRRGIVEIGVPKRELFGLFLQEKEEIGLMLYVQVQEKGMISLTEPWSIFDFTLVK